MPSVPPDRDIQIRLDALSAGLRQRNICVLRQTPDHQFILAENVPAGWPQQVLVGHSDVDALPPAWGADFVAAFDRCVRKGGEETISLDLGEGLRRRQYKARLLPDATGVTTVVTDVTEELSRELAVATLLREVSHRSKNLLAIVQSVAMQTAHHSGSIKDFLDKFRGRLHALSGTQDLVTESNWRGTDLRSLVASQLARVGSAALANVHVTGENPVLGPNASLHIGLALHELGANAVLHGGLADGQSSRVVIDARMVDRPGRSADLLIEWQETGMNAERLRHEPHFGTLVLERIVPLSVGGTADFSIEPDSVRYLLTVPADQFEA